MHEFVTTDSVPRQSMSTHQSSLSLVCRRMLARGNHYPGVASSFASRFVAPHETTRYSHIGSLSSASDTAFRLRSFRTVTSTA